MDYESGTGNKKRGKGFSLIETLVAVSIIVFGILGALTLASTSLKTVSVTKNYLIAENLAQEGVELIRAKKSSNVQECLDNDPSPPCPLDRDWLKDMRSGGVNTVCFSARGCSIDIIELNPRICPANPDQCVLNYNGVYNNLSGGGGPSTIFRRLIRLQEVQTGIEVNVNVEVFWTERFGTQRVIVEENMFNWQ